MTGLFLTTYMILWVIVVVQLGAIFALYHHFGQMYLGSPEGREAQGPKVDARLKSRDMHDLTGEPVVLPTSPRVGLMLFAATNCPLCDKLRPQLGQFAADHPDIATVVICSGETASVREWASDVPGTVRVVADPAHRIARHYDVENLPFCVGTDASGVVRIAGIVNTRRGLEEAVEVVQMSGRVSPPMAPTTFDLREANS